MWCWVRLSWLLGCLVSTPLLADTAEPAKPQVKLSPNTAATAVPTQHTIRSNPKILVYKTLRPDGSASFSDQRPTDQRYELLRFDCFACKPNSQVDWQRTPLFTQRFDSLIRGAAAKHQLDAALIRAVIHAESAFNPKAVSSKGALGLMQLMPATMQQFQVNNGEEPAENIRAGTQYLAQLIREFQGDLTLALAAYNAGPGNVRRYNGIPPFPETQAYIERVKILRQRYATYSLSVTTSP